MTEPTIAQRVHTIIAWQMGRGTNDPTETVLPDDAQLIVDLGADSLDVVEIIMALEEEFDIDIDDDDAEATDGTVGGCVELVRRLTAPPEAKATFADQLTSMWPPAPSDIDRAADLLRRDRALLEKLDCRCPRCGKVGLTMTHAGDCELAALLALHREEGDG